MPTKQAEQLKKTFDEASVENFETLTFGDLKEGDQFICFPLPGDNNGHGGFKGSTFVFTKESMDAIDPSSSVLSGYGIRNSDKSKSSMPFSMAVLRVLNHN